MKTVRCDGARPGLGWAGRDCKHPVIITGSQRPRATMLYRVQYRDRSGYIVVVLLFVTAPVFLLTLISTIK